MRIHYEFFFSYTYSLWISFLLREFILITLFFLWIHNEFIIFFTDGITFVRNHPDLTFYFAFCSFAFFLENTINYANSLSFSRYQHVFFLFVVNSELIHYLFREFDNIEKLLWICFAISLFHYQVNSLWIHHDFR